MKKLTFNVGNNVAFSSAVLKRVPDARGARGVVLEVFKDVARVDFGGTWITHEDGGTCRAVPTANLTKILPSGVVYE